MIVFLLVLALFLSILGSGILFALGFILDFEFSRKLGPILFIINYFIGMILLIPISLLLDTLFSYISAGNKVFLIIAEMLEFGLFCIYLNFTNSAFGIVEFGSTHSEYLLYFLLYILMMLMKFVGDKEKMMRRNVE